MSDERKCQALYRAARHITRRLDRSKLAEKAAAARGSGGSAWISNAALRDLCDAVARFEKDKDHDRT